MILFCGLKGLRVSLENKKVSKVVIRRLPRYYRYLADLKADGFDRISSKELAEKMSVTASQIRQDLNCFGGFGQQGYGYNIETLYAKIGDILGLNRGYKTVIIGAGNLGHALANYTGFERRGFSLVGIYDNNEVVCGTKINHITINHIDKIEEEFKVLKPDIVILTLPNAFAQEMSDKICRLGIKGIWNFSYMELRVPEGIEVENVHLIDSLMTLSHSITGK